MQPSNAAARSDSVEHLVQPKVRVASQFLGEALLLGPSGVLAAFCLDYIYIDIASYTLMPVIIGQVLAISSASSRFSALMIE